MSTQRFNRIFGFDAEKGVVTVEAGITLGELFGVCVPHENRSLGGSFR